MLEVGQPSDWVIVQHARDWSQRGERLTLITLLSLVGAGPRRPGAMCLISDHGNICGSVSGGCIEEDLLRRYGHVATENPHRLTYGSNPAEAERFMLPCGAAITLWVEPFNDAALINNMLHRLETGQRFFRVSPIDGGHHTLVATNSVEDLRVEDGTVQRLYGPSWNAYIIGANETSCLLASLLSATDFSVQVCEPRPQFRRYWSNESIVSITICPKEAEDFLVDCCLDERSFVIFLAHDGKIEDLAILYALQSQAVYVGAMGSIRNTRDRQKRLIEHFDATPSIFDRLDAPIGFDLKSRTSSEIAISIAAKVVKIRNRLRP